MTVARWPVHPPPIPGEALTSWLGRLAAALHTDEHSLLADVEDGVHWVDDIDNLDIVVPPTVAHRLSARTGATADRVRRMSLTGWHPSLLGTGGYAAYTRSLAVLLPPRPQRRASPPGWLPWIGSDLLLMWRVCPTCIDRWGWSPPYPYWLAWALPVLLSCPIHHRVLEFYADPPRDYVRFPYREPPPPSPAVTVMDARTWQALATGRVVLPGGTVDAAMWLRLLRTVIDELADNATAETADRNWQPYEDLDPTSQNRVLEAVATALDELRSGPLTGRGQDAALLRPVRRGRVHLTPETRADGF